MLDNWGVPSYRTKFPFAFGGDNLFLPPALLRQEVPGVQVPEAPETPAFNVQTIGACSGVGAAFSGD